LGGSLEYSGCGIDNNSSINSGRFFGMNITPTTHPSQHHPNSSVLLVRVETVSFSFIAMIICWTFKIIIEVFLANIKGLDFKKDGNCLIFQEVSKFGVS
jgi:hypothetical protein